MNCMIILPQKGHIQTCGRCGTRYYLGACLFLHLQQHNKYLSKLRIYLFIDCLHKIFPPYPAESSKTILFCPFCGYKNTQERIWVSTNFNGSVGTCVEDATLPILAPASVGDPKPCCSPGQSWHDAGDALSQPETARMAGKSTHAKSVAVRLLSHLLFIQHMCRSSFVLIKYPPHSYPHPPTIPKQGVPLSQSMDT